jgi:hypothetical protein
MLLHQIALNVSVLKTIDKHKNIYLKRKYVFNLNIINLQAHTFTTVNLVSWQINICNLHTFFCFINVFMCLIYTKYRIISTILMVLVPLFHGLKVTKILE